MKNVLIIFLIMILVVGAIVFYKILTTKPKGPSYPEKGRGYPTQQLNQAADSARRVSIKELSNALRKYSTKYGRSPDKLEDLVSDGFMASIPVDPLTNKQPAYYRFDASNGCRVESQLSDGSFIQGYCK